MRESTYNNELARATSGYEMMKIKATFSYFAAFITRTWWIGWKQEIFFPIVCQKLKENIILNRDRK